MRWRPYFAYGRHQLRIGVKQKHAVPPFWTFRYIALEWQL